MDNKNTEYNNNFVNNIKEIVMKLELYYFESCPFCQMVLIFISDFKNSIILKDTKKVEYFREELIETTGKKQVPCLTIDGKPMLESRDIINFLSKNKDKWIM